MGLHWATEANRPLPLAVVDELRSSVCLAVHAGRLLARTLRTRGATPSQRPRLTKGSPTIGAQDLRAAR